MRYRLCWDLISGGGGGDSPYIRAYTLILQFVDVFVRIKFKVHVLNNNTGRCKCGTEWQNTGLEIGL